MKALILLLLAVTAAAAQTPKAAAPDPWKALHFLEGSWEAKTAASGVSTSGVYTFRLELDKHIMARHSVSAAGCKGPQSFDCDHTDLLYLYIEDPSGPVKAIYFDNEGHVLHYAVSAPDATTAIFVTDPATPGPRFRLIYHLEDTIMSGKFQMQPPGATSWSSYLEWSGAKH